MIEEDGALPGVDLNLAAKIREAPHVRLNVVEKDNSNKFSNIRMHLKVFKGIKTCLNVEKRWGAIDI